MVNSLSMLRLVRKQEVLDLETKLGWNQRCILGEFKYGLEQEKPWKACTIFSMTRLVYPKAYPLTSGRQTKAFKLASDRILHAMYRLEHRGLVKVIKRDKTNKAQYKVLEKKINTLKEISRKYRVRNLSVPKNIQLDIKRIRQKLGRLSMNYKRANSWELTKKGKEVVLAMED